MKANSPQGMSLSRKRSASKSGKSETSAVGSRTRDEQGEGRTFPQAPSPTITNFLLISDILSLYSLIRMKSPWALERGGRKCRPTGYPRRSFKSDNAVPVWLCFRLSITVPPWHSLCRGHSGTTMAQCQCLAK